MSLKAAHFRVLPALLGAALLGLASLALAPPAAAEDAGVGGHAALSGPAGLAPDADQAIKRYKRTYIIAYTEYQTNTCKPIGPGSWAPNNKPKYGAMSFGYIVAGLGNGDCPGRKYTFAALYYTWERHSNESVQDGIVATWKAPDFNVPFKEVVEVPVVHPVGDTTVASGWDADGLGLWAQTLISPGGESNFDWSFDTVREDAPSAGGPDTCWFPKSRILPFHRITGGTWYPDEKGEWKYDHVGWFTSSVAYYRKAKRAPCGTKFPQQMRHKAQVEKDFVDYGPVNTLGGSFTYRTVTSTRQGKSQTVVR
jgi:hypothetical protein